MPDVSTRPRAPDVASKGFLNAGEASTELLGVVDILALHLWPSLKSHRRWDPNGVGDAGGHERCLWAAGTAAEVFRQKGFTACRRAGVLVLAFTQNENPVTGRYGLGIGLPEVEIRPKLQRRLGKWKVLRPGVHAFVVVKEGGSKFIFETSGWQLRVVENYPPTFDTYVAGPGFDVNGILYQPP